MSGEPIKRKLMVVTWLDHFDNANWHSLDEVSLKPWSIESIGWVIAEDDTMIVLGTGICKGRNRLGYSVSILKAVIVDSYEIVM